jgi:hypothetical protein
MGWKNLSYWLRGGIIGLIVGLFLLGIILIDGGVAQCDGPEGVSCNSWVGEIVMSIFLFIALPFVLVGSSFNSSSFGPVGVILFFIGVFISPFLWGALIGLIVGKIKNRKS